MLKFAYTALVISDMSADCYPAPFCGLQMIATFFR